MAPDYGKVFLRKGKWCISSIIHEALHACSIISLVPEEDIEPIRLLYEGLTELYTGYLLFKQFRNSYRYRMGDTDVICRLKYPTTTPVWGAFCHFIPISETFRIYFHTDSVDWRSQFDRLAERLHVLG
jgi:hypothetical protein